MAKTVSELEALMVAHLPKFAALENQAMQASYSDDRECAYCGDHFRGAGWAKYCCTECSRDAARERSKAKAA